MLVVTSSLLLLLSTINIHSVSGKATKVAQRGLGCKTNGLARTFAQKLNQNLSKQRIKGRNGKIRGESESRMGQMAAAFAKFDRKLNEMETQGVCLGDQSSHGGAELEAQLLEVIDIMKDVERVENIRTRIKAKMGAVIEKEKGGRDYQGILGALGPIIQAGLPIALQLLQVL